MGPVARVREVEADRTPGVDDDRRSLLGVDRPRWALAVHREHVGGPIPGTVVDVLAVHHFREPRAPVFERQEVLLVGGFVVGRPPDATCGRAPPGALLVGAEQPASERTPAPPVAARNSRREIPRPGAPIWLLIGLHPTVTIDNTQFQNAIPVASETPRICSAMPIYPGEPNVFRDWIR